MYRLVQAISILFIAIYAYLTQPVYSSNYIWALIAVVMLLIGMLRKTHEALSAAGVVVLIYGGIQIYSWAAGNNLTVLGWNELIWLIVFPYAAMVGGIRNSGPAVSAKEEHLSIFQQLHLVDTHVNQEVNMVDEQFKFITGPAFIYKLEEAVIRALRDRAEFYLVLARIDPFMEYKRVFGFDRSQVLLNQVAENIDGMPDGPMVKAHLGDGIFAVLLPVAMEEGANPVLAFENYIDDLFFEMMLVKPRHENQIKLKMKYGTAVCPAQGVEARSLMDWAQTELEGNEDQ